MKSATLHNPALCIYLHIPVEDFLVLLEGKEERKEGKKEGRKEGRKEGK